MVIHRPVLTRLSIAQPVFKVTMIRWVNWRSGKQCNLTTVLFIMYVYNESPLSLDISGQAVWWKILWYHKSNALYLSMIIISCRGKLLINHSKGCKGEPFTPQHHYAYSPYCSLYISKGLTRRICKTMKNFVSCWLFPSFSWLEHLI